ncbi:MAG TPA: AAA family ATPase [Candidatus Paceibacterota bacterium]|nr:AAA family ATPase [Candidatus Paceibacterota bacterium]
MSVLHGHEDKLEAFRKLIECDRLGHAYLFYGSPEIGKYHFARLLAFALEFGSFNIKNDVLIDSMFVEPDEKGTIGIEAVRGVRYFLSQKPLRSSRRLVVINDAKTLTREAQSAMLKIVEEPGEASTIIFVAEEPRTLFAPLRSRLRKVYFRSFCKDELKAILIEHYNVPAEGASALAEKSFGRLGRALKLRKKIKIAKDNLESEISEKAAELYFKGVKENIERLKWLVSREAALKRFNLNTNLQRKALEYKLR